MDLHLIHTLVITPYEATLKAQTFEELVSQDYPIHEVSNAENSVLIFRANPVFDDPFDNIALLEKFAAAIGAKIHWSYKVITR